MKNRCVQKCAQGEYFLAEALVCQSICPFKIYKSVNGQNVCLKERKAPFYEVGTSGVDSYTRLKLDCAELYDPDSGKCVARADCAGRVLDDACLKKCPQTHYLLGNECVLTCPDKQFVTIEDEHVCQKCAKYTLKRSPGDTVVQCVDVCPAGYGLDSSLKQCRGDCKSIQRGMCVNALNCTNSQVATTSACLDSCPADMFQNGRVCVFECRYHFSNRTCCEACPDGHHLNGDECVISCPEHSEWRGGASVCVSCTREAGYGLHLSERCVASCGVSARYKFLATDGTTCAEACLGEKEHEQKPFIYDLDTL